MLKIGRDVITAWSDFFIMIELKILDKNILPITAYLKQKTCSPLIEKESRKRLLRNIRIHERAESCSPSMPVVIEI